MPAKPAAARAAVAKKRQHAGSRMNVLRHGADRRTLSSPGTEDWRELAFLTKVPDPAETLHSGVIWKLCIGSADNWQSREAYLTKDELLIASVGDDIVRDQIPLVNITDVVEKEQAETSLTAVPESARQASVIRRAASSGLVVSSEMQFGNSPRKNSVDLKKEAFNVDPNTLSPSPNAGTFVVTTAPESSSCGRKYLLQVLSSADLNHWVAEIRKHSALARRKRDLAQKSKLERIRDRARMLYLSMPVQLFFAVLIGLNFIVNVIESQLVPEDDSPENRAFEITDAVFTTGFGLELCWNMFVHSPKDFWSDPWNVFDFIVVLFSILSLALEGVPVVSFLRLLRVFRAVRLFRKLTSLRIIFNSIIGSLLPVLNSVAILLLITAMYAIVAVEMYGRDHKEFENFIEALFSMYQVATGDSWAAAISRGLLWKYDADDPTKPPSADQTVFVFFTSYSVISGMVLLNVVIAVLLDNFTRCTQEEEDIAAAEKAAKLHSITDMSACSLDPVLQHLAYFDTMDSLRILSENLFKSFDTENVGRIGYNELKAGLEKLNLEPPIAFSVDDFEYVTEHEVLCDSQGTIDSITWFEIIKHQMELFTKRRVSKLMVTKEWDSIAGLRLMTLKMIMSDGISRVKAFGDSPMLTSQDHNLSRRTSADSVPPLKAVAKKNVEPALAAPIRDVVLNEIKLVQPEKRDCATQTAAVYVCF